MKTLFMESRRRIGAAVILTMVAAMEALAQGRDWERPVVSALDRVANGLLAIGGAALAIAIAILAINYFLSMQIDPNKLKAIFFGGFLLFFGAAAFKAILAVT